MFTLILSSPLSGNNNNNNNSNNNNNKEKTRLEVSNLGYLPISFNS